MNIKNTFTIIYIGEPDRYFTILIRIQRSIELKIIRKIRISEARECMRKYRDALTIVNLVAQTDVQEYIDLLRHNTFKDLTWLFLLNEEPNLLELIKLGENSNINFLVNSNFDELFISKISSLLDFIDTKLQLKREIKERELALTSLLNEKRYAESLINSSMDLIISVDLNRNILEFNSSAEKAFGYTKQEVFGKPVHILYADSGQAQKVYSNTLENHQYSAEVLNMRKNGEIFPSIISASVLVEKDGKKLGLMGVSRDISDWKRVESELKGTKEQAETANKAKSEFLANMSHEIRTPMTSVIGYAELLEDRISERPELLEYVKVIRRNGEHLLRLMNDILDLSLIERGKLTIKNIYCQLQPIVENMQYILQKKANDKQLFFKLEYDGLIPETIYSDPTRILQCLVNLAGNAIKFTPEKGEVCICIRYCRTSSRSFMSLRVKDNGPGVPEEKLTLIMRPFEQGGLPNQFEFEGAGLGLSITRDLAKMLGGSLEVESKVNVGSVFTLKIDCGLESEKIRLFDPNESEENKSNQTDSNLPARKSIDIELHGKILLAEDNTDIRKLLTYFLKKAGARVDSAETGTQALKQALNTKYDLVLMDMRLPELNGIAVVKNLRDKGYDRPIVALTASGMRKSLQDFMDSGCNEYATKPISRLKLLELAERWLERDHPKPAKTKVKIPLGGNRFEDLVELDESRTIMTSPNLTEPLVENESALIYSSYHEDPEMEDIVQEYVSTLPEKLERMNNALESEDLQSLVRIAHGLHGSGGGFGFQVLSDLGANLERILEQEVEKEMLVKSLIDLSKVIDRITLAYESISTPQNF